MSIKGFSYVIANNLSYQFPQASYRTRQERIFASLIDQGDPVWQEPLFYLGFLQRRGVAYHLSRG